jgi:broad specificity phosphatase PhoE
VAHDDHRTPAEIDQHRLEGRERVDVEIVGRLVEQQAGCSAPSSRARQTARAPARELADPQPLLRALEEERSR